MFLIWKPANIAPFAMINHEKPGDENTSALVLSLVLIPELPELSESRSESASGWTASADSAMRNSFLPVWE
jgi:hypothetical protein